jgi:hypothetical protein
MLIAASIAEEGWIVRMIGRKVHWTQTAASFALVPQNNHDKLAVGGYEHRFP